MTKPFVSVVVTTYNYGLLIEEAIGSVLSQDYPADLLEIVVVDDGSTDDTAERVKKCDPRVRYFCKPNGGQASALNLGFAKARGEIISLLDGDDYFYPGKVARVVEAFQRDPNLGMVYHPMEEWNVRTNARRMSRFPLISGSPFENLSDFLWYFGQGTNASFRREFLDRVLPIPEEIRMLADAYPCTLIAFVAPILALPECLSGYRVHGNNSYQVDESQMPIEIRESRWRLWQIVIEAMRKWLADNGYTRKQAAVRCLLDWWTLYQIQGRFLIKPPGRFRYFSYLIRENYAHSPVQTWKVTTLNYITALSAFFFGYHRRRRLEVWRHQAVIDAGALFRRFVGVRPSAGSTPLVR